MVDMAAASSSSALPSGASQQLLEEMQLFLDASPKGSRWFLVLAVIWYVLLSPVWLLSTLSERALSAFLRFSTLSVSSQPPLFPSVSL